MKALSLTVLLTLLFVVNLGAHDFWLAVKHAPSGEMTITGHVGEKFPVSDTRTTPDRVDGWRMIGPSGDVAPLGALFQDGNSLASRVTLPSPGTYLGVMTIQARETEMKGKEFNDYLREEGLDQVIAERARLGQSDVPARERYARYAKVVVRTGGSEAAHVTRASGAVAEFVPSVNPATLSPGETLSLQMLVHGQPVAGALIAAISSSAHLDARTNASGRVTFTIPSKGAWLIKTVYIAKPINAGTPPVDWESYWITLAFEN